MKIAEVIVVVGLLIATAVQSAPRQPDRSRLSLGVFLNYGSGAVTAGQGFSVDDAQNYYVSGHWSGVMYFDDEAAQSSGDRSGYVSKYDREGNLLWHRTFPSTTLPGIAATGTNSVFIAGHFRGATKVGTNLLTARSGQDGFIARLDASGQTMWVKQSEGPGSMAAWGMTSDAEGNAYVSGELNGELAWDGVKLLRVGSRNLFVLKLAPDGKLLWAIRDGDGFVEARGIAVDGEGSVFVTGHFFSTADFQAGKFETPPRTTEMFLAKYSSEGKPLWVRSAGWNRDKTGHKVAVDKQGNVHVVGLYRTNRVTNSDNVYLARYSSAGEFLGVQPYQKGDADFSNIVQLNAASRLKSALTVRRGRTNDLSTDAIRSALAGAVETPATVTSSVPVLQLRNSGEFVVLYWPASFDGFKLESSDVLAPFPFWKHVSAVPQINGAFRALALPLSASEKYYRLRKQ